MRCTRFPPRAAAEAVGWGWLEGDEVGVGVMQRKMLAVWGSHGWWGGWRWGGGEGGCLVWLIVI